MPGQPAFEPRLVPPGLRIRAWHAPDGWAHRAFDWAAAEDARPRGSLLYQGGRADFVEKHLESFHDWHHQGWHVAGFDWRGQGGSGRFLDDRTICHVPSLDPHVDDAAAFINAWQARTPAPHVVVAHSMGAHLILRALAETGVTVDAAALLSPMLGINTDPVPLWLARRLVGGLRRAGLGTRPAWREGRGLATDRARQKFLTSSADRFDQGNWWKRENPHLTVGGPSWDWIAAALASQRCLDAPGVLERLDVPILILAAERDRLVSNPGIARAAARLPHARHRSFVSGHDLLREGDTVRGAAMADIAAFFDAHAPA